MSGHVIPVRESFGSALLTRDQGAAARDKIVAQLHSNGSLTVTLDFKDVTTITPSFLDEMLGRLLLEVGRETFRARIKLIAADETVRRLVNHVLNSRWANRSAGRA